MKFTAGCIQLNSGNNLGENVTKISEMIREAAAEGADFITLPENCSFMAGSEEELRANSFAEADNPVLEEFKKKARECKAWLLVGSLPIKGTGDMLINRSYLINNEGMVASHYDKIHLYDVQVAGGESHNESKRFEHGEKKIMTATPWGKLGMTICYDLRFPALFRALAKDGADFITVPSAFTEHTGKAHWHVLLRTRAIENGCYIIAPAMTGEHPAGRKTYGHSLIIDPWGEVIADAGEEVGIITAEIDVERVAKTRASMPSLSHDRDFS